MRIRVSTFPLLLLPVLLVASCRTSAQGPHAPAPANVLVPQKGVGAPYGTRDPYSCSSKVAPQKGAISPSLAAMYLQCGDETVNSDGYLWLDENVKVQVGGGVKASGTWTYTGGDVNPNELVYPIRGTMDKYLCGKVQHGSVLENEGKNCTLWHWNEATGNCYRTTFGDWKCTMTDLDAQQVADQPPPTK